MVLCGTDTARRPRRCSHGLRVSCSETLELGRIGTGFVHGIEVADGVQPPLSVRVTVQGCRLTTSTTSLSGYHRIRHKIVAPFTVVVEVL
jgi:hypothetical protein